MCLSGRKGERGRGEEINLPLVTSIYYQTIAAPASSILLGAEFARFLLAKICYFSIRDNVRTFHISLKIIKHKTTKRFVFFQLESHKNCSNLSKFQQFILDSAELRCRASLTLYLLPILRLSFISLLLLLSFS